MNSSRKPINKNKNINKKTLDIHHQNKIEEIRINRLKLEEKQQQLSLINQEIDSLSSNLNTENKEFAIERLIVLRDNLLDVQDAINNLESKCNETNYYKNMANILFKYYDINENCDDANKQGTSSNSSILKYFLTNSQTTANLPGKDPEIDKSSLIDSYMTFVDDGYIREKIHDAQDTCTSCGSQAMTIMTNDGYIFCNDCFSIEYIIIDHEKPSYRDPPKEISYFAYKRINHFILECKSRLKVFILLVFY